MIFIATGITPKKPRGLRIAASDFSESSKVKFLSHVKKAGDDECWIIDYKARVGPYTITTMDKKVIFAHRAAYMIANGEVPAGKCVCHKCDSPLCCNPGHLFLGTDQDNVDDCRIKGRRKYCQGSDHGRSKLTETMVLEIRAKYKPFIYTQPMLAIEYGVNLKHIDLILRRKLWKRI